MEERLHFLSGKKHFQALCAAPFSNSGQYLMLPCQNLVPMDPVLTQHKRVHSFAGQVSDPPELDCFFFPPAISVGLLFSSHRKTPLWHLTCTLAEGIWLSSCSGAWTKVCYHQHWLCKTSSSTHMFFWISLNYITLHTGFSKGPSLSFSISEQRRVPMVQFIYCSLLTSSHAGHLLSAVQTSHPR